MLLEIQVCLIGFEYVANGDVLKAFLKGCQAVALPFETSSRLVYESVASGIEHTLRHTGTLGTSWHRFLELGNAHDCLLRDMFQTEDIVKVDWLLVL